MANGNGNGAGRVASFFRDWIPLIALVVSGLVWGLKLESRYDVLEARLSTNEKDIAANRAALDRGILPRAEEKVSALDRQVYSMQQRIERLENKHADNGKNR